MYDKQSIRQVDITSANRCPLLWFNQLVYTILDFIFKHLLVSSTSHPRDGGLIVPYHLVREGGSDRALILELRRDGHGQWVKGSAARCCWGRDFVTFCASVVLSRADAPVLAPCVPSSARHAAICLFLGMRQRTVVCLLYFWEYSHVYENR